MSEIIGILRELFLSGGGRVFSVISSIFIAFLLLHGSSFWSSGVDLIDGENFSHQWDVSFTESVTTESETVLIGDEESHEFRYESERSTIGDRMVARFLITVSYDETSGGAANPCDSVTANIKPTNMDALWTNNSSIVSGNSDDCSDIEMILLVYPGYDSNSKNSTGVKQEDVLSTWMIQDYGIGELICEVAVDTTDSPISTVPLTGSDEGEEISVSWERVEFKPDASRID